MNFVVLLFRDFPFIFIMLCYCLLFAYVLCYSRLQKYVWHDKNRQSTVNQEQRRIWNLVETKTLLFLFVLVGIKMIYSLLQYKNDLILRVNLGGNYFFRNKMQLLSFSLIRSVVAALVTLSLPIFCKQKISELPRNCCGYADFSNKIEINSHAYFK